MSANITDRAEEKYILRRTLRVRRAALAQGAEGTARCLRIQNNLLESRLWHSCSRVILYFSAKGEVDTSLLLTKAWASGREVFLPRCRPEKSGLMDMIACSGTEKLRVSFFGIFEPELTADSRLITAKELESEETLLVVPALAFDRKGFRLGLGGGYYDRFLSHVRCPSVGITFHDLVLPDLPHEEWDMPVQTICTEESLQCILP